MALGAAALIGGGSLLSGVIGAGASKKAASQQAQAAQTAAFVQSSIFNLTSNRLQPFVNTGTAANEQLAGLLGLAGHTANPTAMGGLGTGALVQPFQPTMAQLEQTPGYQFTKQQGLEATTNAAAAMGLGKSGSLLKGIDQFSTGLASQTYQQQFNNYWTQLGQIRDMLQGVSVQGSNAAAQVGTIGQAAGAGIGNSLTAAGSAQGQGTLNAAGSLTGGIGGIGQSLLLSNLLGKGGGVFGGDSGITTAGATNPFAGSSAFSDQFAGIGNQLGIGNPGFGATIAGLPPSVPQ